MTGSAHDGSDLDLVLRGPGLRPMPDAAVSDLADAFEASNIPILVEARDWARLPESFHRESERAHVVLQPGASPAE